MTTADVAERARRQIAGAAHKAAVLLRAADRGEPVDVSAIERELGEVRSGLHVLVGCATELRCARDPGVQAGSA